MKEFLILIVFIVCAVFVVKRYNKNSNKSDDE